MPEAQKNAFIKFARDVVKTYGITEIKGHREVGDTDCPGKYFPLDEIRNAILGGAPQETPAPQPVGAPGLVRNLKFTSPMMRGNDVRAAQEQLAFHKAQPGKIDGIFGEKTRDAVVRFQKARIAEGDDLGSAGADGVIGPKTYRLLMQGRK